MTEQEQTELNGQIAATLYGWSKTANGWSDPTGDEFVLPFNYTDNSGLVVGLEYKLRRRGFSLTFNWPLGEAVEYRISGNGKEAVGVANTKSMAICLAIQALFAQQAIV